eukprot:TRINITY_DN4574_c0_g1_i1.p3 TRINITY_DN4574_c0_g1~~TRINITY_DN4574_c0_g1_i1.p3  ORF type:complete len:108 (-),score=42.15 TRINITY_DN4574_c0_g1_i1:159-482(-)
MRISESSGNPDFAHDLLDSQRFKYNGAVARVGSFIVMALLAHVGYIVYPIALKNETLKDEAMVEAVRGLWSSASVWMLLLGAVFAVFAVFHDGTVLKKRKEEASSEQ